MRDKCVCQIILIECVSVVNASRVQLVQRAEALYNIGADARTSNERGRQRMNERVSRRSSDNAQERSDKDILEGRYVQVGVGAWA